MPVSVLLGLKNSGDTEFDPCLMMSIIFCTCFLAWDKYFIKQAGLPGTRLVSSTFPLCFFPQFSSELIFILSRSCQTVCSLPSVPT